MDLHGGHPTSTCTTIKYMYIVTIEAFF